MAKSNPLKAVALQKRGSGLVVPVSMALAEQLGWNRNDLLQPVVVDGCLVVQRVVLPKVPQLRKKHEENTVQP